MFYSFFIIYLILLVLLCKCFSNDLSTRTFKGRVAIRLLYWYEMQLDL